MSHNSGDQTLQWPGAEQLDAMGTMQDMQDIQDMDFSNFLDIGDLDLTAFSPLGHDSHVDATHGAGHTDNNSCPLPLHNDGMGHDFTADSFELPMAMDHNEMLHSSHNVNGQETLDFVQPAHDGTWAHQQHSQAQHMQPQSYQPPQHVPPTPNSYDMHGNPGRYLQQQMDPQTRSFLEQRYQLKNDEVNASFTPLVSPAVTPVDSRFQHVPEYTVPGAYFSPLTSPALQAQNANQQNQQQPFGYNPSTAASSVATSPIDLKVDVEMTGNDSSQLDSQRKPRRKPQNPRSTGPSARVRQSPIVKPQQKRKSTLSTVIPSKDIQNILREAQNSASPPSASTFFRNVPFVDSSGTESISPDTLSEAVMGPPPRPISAVQSPALLAQSQSAPASSAVTGTSGAPATPASLMSLKRSRQLARAQGIPISPSSVQSLPLMNDDTAMFDDFALPPAANTDTPIRPAPDRIIMSAPSVSTDATPRLAARKTPNIAPSGFTAHSHSATSSPAISATASPAIAATPSSMAGRRSDSKTSRGSKSRGSVAGAGSVLISPAIRPKISPSIKPLLPEGANLNESQQALLLASKSNYTHILEGTLLPGVTYPESLSSGLTSKRTSHKIAEQGRRNRINDALKEMQALLPKPGGISNSSNGTANQSSESLPADEDDGDKDSSKPGGSSDSKSASSKAATVESAIEYIKALQVERVQLANMMKTKDEELATLRQKLQGFETTTTAATKPIEQPDMEAGTTD